ncbi:hypothetical protein DHEL01_v205878 [Diaporthe helianthi]|uniref:protein-ribulosamine 3-kinase n=1 Tax=Diaporthe helianthi TaxID=158607 RepID=A0A2P5HZQ0_DIAHE|nr:hypothetical protein DHEL01_v205878 [Diaporthe helianthi]
MPHFESAPQYSETDPAQAAKREQTHPVPPYEDLRVQGLVRRDTERIFFDQAVINALGDDETIVNAERYGNSSWSATGKLTTKRPDGTLHEYFLKIIKGDLAGPRVLGEFACMKELESAVPSLVPSAKAAGKCFDSEGAFFLCDYLEIDHRPANPEQLGKKIAELHKASVSPTGKFGFHLTPYDGKLPLAADWDSSWTSFFTKLLSGVHQLDRQVNGAWPELDDAMELTLRAVVPRLLGRLTEDGRGEVKPCLIHGDLHEQNIGTEPRTGSIYIFDSCAYYAHHEMAMGMWRVDHHHMKAREYRREYFKNYPPDEPQDEADDRNRLYAVKEEIMYSAHVPGTKARAQALDDLKFLIEKYVEYEDSEEDSGEDDESDAASSADERQVLVPRVK